MAAGSSVGSQKEMTAVINNLKEARVLDKAMDTLNLEESYSVKLLHLDTKIIKLKYNRLENNVGKIKTNLKPEDISAMKKLELGGKFQAKSPTVASTSHSKIMAAAKRLKFNNTSYRRAISAMPRLEKSQITLSLNTAADRKLSQSAKAESSSVSSKQSMPSSTLNHRKQSLTSDRSDVGSVLCAKARPRTVVGDRVLLQKRKSVDEGQLKPRLNTTQILERIAAAQKAHKRHHRPTLYSCHDGKSDGRGGFVGGAFSANPYELRRKHFLEEEHLRTSRLVVQKTQFIASTKRFIDANPCEHYTRPERTEEVIRSIDSTNKRSGNQTMIANKARQRKALLDRTDSASLLKNFADIKKQLLELGNNLN